MTKRALQVKIAPAIDDPEWVKWAQIRTEKTLKEMPELKPLQDKLLSLGGDWVALQPEPDLEILIEKGELFIGKVILKPMAICQCHKNCTKLWEEKPKAYKIATGWALSSDGIWRQHTWLLKKSSIYETTSMRELYYGYMLDEIAANNFWLENSL